MSANRYIPHLLILPEDDADRQLANGFALEIPPRRCQVLTEVGGWSRVRDTFVDDHVAYMRENPRRHMILLVDFDGNPNRLQVMRAAIPQDLIDRVFVVGAFTKPEALRQAIGLTFEEIGKAVARDCRTQTGTIWDHELLAHNAAELARVCAVCQFLFSDVPI